MKILFLHGWHSVAGGVKPTYLRSHGHEVHNPQLNDDAFEQALALAQQVYDDVGPEVVVGSSRGGAIAMNINSEGTPLVLLCPAWKRWGHSKAIKANCIILHSRHDDVIPYEDSLELVANSHLEEETLVDVGVDHRLADDSSLAIMLWACEILTSGSPLPWLEENREVGDEVRFRNGSQLPKIVAQSDGKYLCDSCGEEIVIPLDWSEGDVQEYTEDCPVCCNPNVIHIAVDVGGRIKVWADAEQDHE